jgi:hypothetical protein
MAQRGGGNNQQWRIIGALNALTGQVNYLDDYIVGCQQVNAMYQRLAAIYQPFQHIYVVQDNWSIHRHDDVLAACSRGYRRLSQSGCQRTRLGSTPSRSSGVGYVRMCSRCIAWQRSGRNANGASTPFWISLRTDRTIRCTMSVCWVRAN